MRPADTDKLKQFLGAYFHQDWMDQAPTYVGIVELYRAHFPDYIDRESVAELLDRLNSEHSDDRKLEETLFQTFSCEFVPSDMGLSARSWLKAVAAQLREDR